MTSRLERPLTDDELEQQLQAHEAEVSDALDVLSSAEVPYFAAVSAIAIPTLPALATNNTA